MVQSPAEQNESFALIIDTSSSAAHDMDAVRETAQLIYRLAGVEDEEQFKLFMLGSTTSISSMSLKQTTPPGVDRQPQACSLITPIMETLAREGQRRMVIIVGNGEIFDLDDWSGDPRFDGWLLVRTKGQPLQKYGGRISEITAEQISGDLDTLLSYFSRPPAAKLEAPPMGNYFVSPDTYRWQVDASGYPLIFVEPLGAFVQLFPVTKPQFEKFIASDRQLSYGDEWYGGILNMNPRTSYRSQTVPERERLFMTGVTPDEALAFGRWIGWDYTLLTAQEWHTCYEWFAGQPAPLMPPDISERLSQDALAIWDIANRCWLERHRLSNLQELSLMTRGILEWVIERPGRYCGFGEPAASKLQRRANDPVRPVGQSRLRNLGFRLRTR